VTGFLIVRALSGHRRFQPGDVIDVRTSLAECSRLERLEFAIFEVPGDPEDLRAFWLRRGAAAEEEACVAAAEEWKRNGRPKDRSAVVAADVAYRAALHSKPQREVAIDAATFPADLVSELSRNRDALVVAAPDVEAAERAALASAAEDLLGRELTVEESAFDAKAWNAWVRHEQEVAKAQKAPPEEIAALDAALGAILLAGYEAGSAARAVATADAKLPAPLVLSEADLSAATRARVV
jgi:hypothetical protein